jgi:selenocysteine-specific elongation factor
MAVVARLLEAGEMVALEAGRPSGGTGSETVRRLGGQTIVVTRAGWDGLVDRVRRGLGDYHRAFPLRRGMPKEELRTRLGLDARLFARLADRLLAEGVVAEAGPFLHLPEHVVAFTPEQQRIADRLLGELRRGGASPPGRAELEARLGATSELIEDLIYPRDVYELLVEDVVTAIRDHGPLTVATVRDLFDTSRKYALALLGHLDERKITRRVGDERVLY